MKSIKLLTLLLLTVTTSGAQVAVLDRAHAHNDYEHERPLTGALSFGFISVEADVHLMDNQLYVSHNRPLGNTARTLEQLYLKPLDSIIQSSGGRVYKNYNSPFFLMIDFKTEGIKTFSKLIEILEPYHHHLTGSNPPLVIFISGNRPVEAIKQDEHQWVSIDGRPDQLGKGFDSKLMPVVSIDFKSLSKWDGTGEMPLSDRTAIQILAQSVHNENKKLRLWAIPDNVQAWKTLADAGVDFINTDKLKELKEFLTNYTYGHK